MTDDEKALADVERLYSARALLIPDAAETLAPTIAAMLAGVPDGQLAEVARAAGMHASNIGRLARPDRDPSGSSFLRVARACGFRVVIERVS